MVRERFENDLQDVQKAFLELSTKAIDAFELAFKAFVEKIWTLHSRLLKWIRILIVWRKRSMIVLFC